MTASTSTSPISSVYIREIDPPMQELNSFIKEIPADLFLHNVLPFLNYKKDLPCCRGVCRTSSEITPDICAEVRCVQLPFKTAKKLTLAEVQEYEKLFGKPLTSDNLIFLDLSNSNIDDEQLTRYRSRFPNLNMLNLRRCDGITAMGLNSLRNFSYLDLGFCPAVSDDVVPSILINNPALQHFDLSGCEITDESLTEIANASLARAKALPGFRSLAFHQCEDLTDAGVESIARDCPNLENLDLGWCHQLSDSSVREITNNCPKIRTLNIAGCDKLTDSSVSAIAFRLEQLEDLDLENCEKVTSSSMRAISVFCLKMKKLSVKFCPQITASSTLDLVLRDCQVIR